LGGCASCSTNAQGTPLVGRSHSGKKEKYVFCFSVFLSLFFL